MIAVQEAKSIIQKRISLLGTETVSLHDAGNRVLGQDIVATFPLPRFNNSAMDGFSLRAADTNGASQSNPVTLKMVSVSSAGTPSEIIVDSGECTQCMTGAKIPDGADTIVMVEDTSGFSDADDTRRLHAVLKSHYLPNLILVQVEPGEGSQVSQLMPWINPMTVNVGHAVAYVCRDFVCQRPVTDPEEFDQQLATLKGAS